MKMNLILRKEYPGTLSRYLKAKARSKNSFRLPREIERKLVYSLCLRQLCTPYYCEQLLNYNPCAFCQKGKHCIVLGTGQPNDSVWIVMR